MNLKKGRAIVVLQDGTIFEGESFGYLGDTSGEIVFNTSMAGYQEILTDPSYVGQIVTMTYPMIGNYGVNLEDVESAKPQVAGFLVKDYVEAYSNFRAKESLGAYLHRNQIVGITGVETRALVRHIRLQGAMPGLISVSDFDLPRLQKKAKQLPSMEGQDLVQLVSTKEVYSWDEGIWDLGENHQQEREHIRLRVVVYDFGVKSNILRCLVNEGFEVTVVPAHTDYTKVLDLEPDGVFLSNGPGDPAVVHYGISQVQGLLGKVPLFGICLGHQILSLAMGAKTYKLKFGHRGANHPVKDLQTAQVEITSQNHGFAVEDKSISKEGEVTHINLNDRTVEGVSHKKFNAFGIQYHPEASPGPHDSYYLFKRFRHRVENQ